MGKVFNFTTHFGMVLIFAFFLAPYHSHSTSSLNHTPRTFTIDELRKMVQDQDFTIRTNMNHFRQARATLLMRHNNLVPHLSMNAITTLATFSPGGIISAIGDLAPFLLPNRWYKVEESEHLFRAENFATMAAKDNSIQLVESFALEIDRCQTNLEILNLVRKDYLRAINRAESLEADHKITKGNSLGTETKLQILDQVRLDLEYKVQQLRVDLAEAMAFSNLNVVASIQAIKYADEKFPLTYNLFDIQRRTINTSRELLEMDQLIAAASSNVGSAQFEWLDPYSDGQAGLGLGHGNYVDIATIDIDSLVRQRQVIVKSLYRQASRAFADWQINLQLMVKTDQTIALQRQRIELAYAQLDRKPDDHIYGHIEEALDLLTEQMLQRNNQLYSWYGALSKIYRLTHTRYY